MKQNDIALIIVVVFISAIVSIFASKALIASPKNRKQQVEVVPVVTETFETPDSHYFNDQSFDPTKIIKIGDNNNQNPFNGKQQ